MAETILEENSTLISEAQYPVLFGVLRMQLSHITIQNERED